MRVAILEESYMLREALKKYIELQPKFSLAFTAGSQREFVTILTSSTKVVDTVILDIHTHNIISYELIQKLKDHPVFGKINFLIYSNFNNQMIFDRLKCFPIKGYVFKSSPNEVLLQALEAISNGTTYFDHGITHELCPDLWCSTKCYRELVEGEIDLINTLHRCDTRRDMAKLLQVDPRTVNNRRTAIIRKLKACSFHQAVIMAYFYGLIQLPK
ncbi:DNA-binding response regulator [Myroides sp. LJL110]